MRSRPSSARREVEQTLDDEGAVLSSRAAVGRHDRPVGEDGAELAAVGRHAIEPERVRLRVERHGQPVRIVGAGIVPEGVVEAEDPAVGVDGELGVVNLRTLLGRRNEVLGAVARPFDRSTEPDRRPGDEHLLRVEHHDLRPEAAADERRHHPHLVLREPEHRGETIADRDRRLRRIPDHQPLVAWIPRGDDRAPFERRGRTPIVDQAARDDDDGAGARRLPVAPPLDDVGGEIRLEIVVHPRRPGRERRLELAHGIERLEVDLDQGHRILGQVAALGDHQRDRFADVPHLLLRERHLSTLVKDGAVDRRRRDQERPGSPVVAEIGRGVDRDDARQRQRASGVDRADPRMRVRAAEKGRVEQPRQLDIVDEERPPGEQAGVFIARRARADGQGLRAPRRRRRSGRTPPRRP